MKSGSVIFLRVFASNEIYSLEYTDKYMGFDGYCLTAGTKLNPTRPDRRHCPKQSILTIGCGQTQFEWLDRNIPGLIFWKQSRWFRSSTRPERLMNHSNLTATDLLNLC
jgi:hypothetical protein